jgi:hypothetical protein
MEHLRVAVISLLLLENLEILVDDGDGKQDTRAGADGAQQIRNHGQRANAETTEGGGGGDVAIQDLAHGLRIWARADEDHLLLDQLVGDVLGGGA